MARRREDKPRSSYLDIVSYAKAEGGAYRSRFPSRTRSGQADRTPRETGKRAAAPSRTHAMLLQSSADSRESTVPDAPGADNLHLLGEQLISDATSDLPSNTVPTHDEEGEDPLAYFGRQVPASRVAFQPPQMRNNRPGWRDNRRDVPYSARSQLIQLICYVCYALGHTANQCVHPMRDRRSVVANFEALTAEQKENVPDISYTRAKADLGRAGPAQRFAQPPDSRPTPGIAPVAAVEAPSPRPAEVHPSVLSPVKEEPKN